MAEADKVTLIPGSLTNMQAIDQCENLELNSSNEWEPLNAVKHEGRNVGRMRKPGNQSSCRMLLSLVFLKLLL